MRMARYDSHARANECAFTPNILLMNPQLAVSFFFFRLEPALMFDNVPRL